MRRIAYVVLCLTFVCSASVYSQNVKFGIAGGTNYVLTPTSYRKAVDTAGVNSGFDANFHLGVIAKSKMQYIPVRWTGTLMYNYFHGSKENVVISPTQAIDLETSTSVFTVGIGGEYLFLPGAVSPYASLDLNLNFIGDRSFERKTPSGSVSRNTERGTRFGIGLGTGIDFTLAPEFDIGAGVKFNFLNLIGQTSDEGTFTTFDITLSLMYRPL